VIHHTWSFCLIFEVEVHGWQVLSCLESCESPLDFVCSRPGGDALLAISGVDHSRVHPPEPLNPIPRGCCPLFIEALLLF